MNVPNRMPIHIKNFKFTIELIAFDRKELTAALKLANLYSKHVACTFQRIALSFVV